PRMLDAMVQAIRMLKTAAPPPSGLPPRRVIFLISDGSNLDSEGPRGTPVPPDVRDDVNKAAKTAAEAGITIHTPAFSLTARREPYMGLGQMSKKASGTYRWARGRADFVPAIDSLAAELLSQMVLTFFIAPESIAGKRVKVLCKSPACGPELPLASN